MRVSGLVRLIIELHVANVPVAMHCSSVEEVTEASRDHVIMLYKHRQQEMASPLGARFRLSNDTREV